MGDIPVEDEGHILDVCADSALSVSCGMLLCFATFDSGSGTGSQPHSVGLATISQKTASTARKAGHPNANHTCMQR